MVRCRSTNKQTNKQTSKQTNKHGPSPISLSLSPSLSLSFSFLSPPPPKKKKKTRAQGLGRVEGGLQQHVGRVASVLAQIGCVQAHRCTTGGWRGEVHAAATRAKRGRVEWVVVDVIEHQHAVRRRGLSKKKKRKEKKKKKKDGE